MSLISKGMPNKLREVVFIQILKNLKMLGSWNINKITTSDLFKKFLSKSIRLVEIRLHNHMRIDELENTPQNRTLFHLTTRWYLDIKAYRWTSHSVISWLITVSIPLIITSFLRWQAVWSGCFWEKAVGIDKWLKFKALAIGMCGTPVIRIGTNSLHNAYVKPWTLTVALKFQSTNGWNWMIIKPKY